jgi:tetratricopeptide (TPR) repeat protein
MYGEISLDDAKILIQKSRSDPYLAIEKITEQLLKLNSRSKADEWAFLYRLLGNAFANLDQPVDAIINYDQALSYLNSFNRNYQIGEILTDKGNVFFELKLYDEATIFYTQSYEMFKNINAVNNMKAVESNLALLEKEKGNFTEAKKRYLGLYTSRIGLDKVFTAVLLAELELQSNKEADSALIWLYKAEKELIGMEKYYEYNKIRGYVYEYKADSFVQKNDVDSALINYILALDYYEKSEFSLWIRAQKKKASLLFEMGEKQQAIEEIQNIFAKIGPEISVQVYADINRFYASYLYKINRVEEAITVLESVSEKTINIDDYRAKQVLKIVEFSKQLNRFRETVSIQKQEINRTNIISIIIITAFIIITGLTILYVNRQRIVNEQKLKLKEQELLLLNNKFLESKWRSLRLQLKPHFLYNILNSLQALIHFNQDKAADLISYLSGYFQNILSSESREITKLSHEIDLCKNYLSLQEIRFNGLLKFSIELGNSDASAINIPSMLLFPLVENAAKYGYQTTLNDDVYITLRVNIDTQKHMLLVEVENTGKWVESDKLVNNIPFESSPIDANESGIYQGGIGWKNIQERLKSRFDDDWSLTHKQQQNSVVVSLVFPYL